MPYGDASALTTIAPWPDSRPRPASRRLLPLALATVLSFAAGVGSTLAYLQVQPPEFAVGEAPLIEADRTPTRVRPEGLASAAPSSGLPSAIAAAQAAPPPVPTIDLAAQGIPAAVEIAAPAGAEMVELKPPAPAVAAPEPVLASAATPADVVPEVAAVPAGPEIRLQVASLRTEAKAVEEMNRFKRVHAAVVADLEFEVQRLDQGARGVFYRVLSSPVGARDDGVGLCAALAERRAQCQVMTFQPRVTETRVAVAPAAPAPAEINASVSRVETPRGEVRAQLATLRTFEGAARELNRLARLYGGVLEQTELSVSRIDQGERGVFYRILTAPLPDREAAGELCQRLGANYVAGCVLIGQRPTA